MLEKDGLRGLVPTRTFGRKDTVYNSYLNTLNPRENQDVQMALAQNEDPRFQAFLDRLNRRSYKKIALSTIAKQCEIPLMEFTKWWNQASSQVAIAKAQNGSIRITEDMVEDAKTQKVVCERCDGMKWISAPPGLPPDTPGYKSFEDNGDLKWIRTCPSCDEGKVKKPGDSHARDRILEMSGLIQKGKGGVTLVQNFGGASHSSAINMLDDAMTLDVTSGD